MWPKRSRRVFSWTATSAHFRPWSPGLASTFFVLGKDGNLWWEPWPSATSPNHPERQIIDANVQAFQPLDVYDVIVLGGDGNL